MSLRRSMAALAGWVLLTAASPCLAQAWPTRTVKVVVPYASGGITDTMARLTADRLGKIFGQSFYIENKPGAGGAIGVDYALHSPDDGYTIMFVGSTLFTVLPLAQKVNYEPLKDLVPISITGTNGMILVAAKDAPYSTLREFIDYARARPGKITYSSGGPATNNHLATAYFAGKVKLDMVHVPFKGGQPALTAVMSKSVDMLFGNSSDLIEPVSRAIAGEDCTLEAGDCLADVADRDVLAEDLHEEFPVAGDLLHLRSHHIIVGKAVLDRICKGTD